MKSTSPKGHFELNWGQKNDQRKDRITVQMMDDEEEAYVNSSFASTFSTKENDSKNSDSKNLILIPCVFGQIALFPPASVSSYVK